MTCIAVTLALPVGPMQTRLLEVQSDITPANVAELFGFDMTVSVQAVHGCVTVVTVSHGVLEIPRVVIDVLGFQTIDIGNAGRAGREHHVEVKVDMGVRPAEGRGRPARRPN